MNVLTRKIQTPLSHLFSFSSSFLHKPQTRRVGLHLMVQFLLLGIFTSTYGWFYAIFRALTSDAGTHYTILVGVLFVGFYISEKLSTDDIRSKLVGSLFVIGWGVLWGYILLVLNMLGYFNYYELRLESADYAFLWQNIFSFILPSLTLAEIIWHLNRQRKRIFIGSMVFIILGIAIKEYGFQPQFEKADLFTIQQDRGEISLAKIDEPSGLATSLSNSAVIWTHNDGTSNYEFYALDTNNHHIATFKLNGIFPRDIEDMAIAYDSTTQDNFIYLADIGDNYAFYNQLKIYRLPEPSIDQSQIPIKADILDKIETMHLRYPYMKRDAEALMVDPWDQHVYIITKREANARLYTAGKYTPNESPQKLTFLLTFDFRSIVAADISPNGEEILMKTYREIFYWKRKKGERLVEVLARPPLKLPYIPEPQGEAIAWAADGSGYYTLSELNQGIMPRLYFYERK